MEPMRKAAEKLAKEMEPMREQLRKLVEEFEKENKGGEK